MSERIDINSMHVYVWFFTPPMVKGLGFIHIILNIMLRSVFILVTCACALKLFSIYRLGGIGSRVSSFGCGDWDLGIALHTVGAPTDNGEAKGKDTGT